MVDESSEVMDAKRSESDTACNDGGGGEGDGSLGDPGLGCVGDTVAGGYVLAIGGVR